MACWVEILCMLVSAEIRSRHCVHCIAHIDKASHRGGKGRGETARMSLPSQLECIPQLCLWWLYRVHMLLCPSKNFRRRNKNTLFIVIVYSALFNNVFTALNLFLNKYIAEIQLPGNSISRLSIPQRFYTEFWYGLALVINITNCKE